MSSSRAYLDAASRLHDRGHWWFARVSVFLLRVAVCRPRPPSRVARGRGRGPRSKIDRSVNPLVGKSTRRLLNKYPHVRPIGNKCNQSDIRASDRSIHLRLCRSSTLKKRGGSEVPTHPTGGGRGWGGRYPACDSEVWSVGRSVVEWMETCDVASFFFFVLFNRARRRRGIASGVPTALIVDSTTDDGRRTTDEPDWRSEQRGVDSRVSFILPTVGRVASRRHETIVWRAETNGDGWENADGCGGIVGGANECDR